MDVLRRWAMASLQNDSSGYSMLESQSALRLLAWVSVGGWPPLRSPGSLIVSEESWASAMAERVGETRKRAQVAMARVPGSLG